MALVYMFPGQGTQHVGMGAGLFERYTREVNLADDVLGYSVKDLCLRDPNGRLECTEYTQPALYVVNALHYFAERDAGREPDFATGHSLGEYSALLAAGAFDFGTGLRLVQERGRLMAKARGGGMAAVVGLAEGPLRDEIRGLGLHTLDIANFNSPQQLVLSGPREDIDRAAAHLAQMDNVHVAPLRVSGAFHSRYMATAEAEFHSFARGFDFHALRFPVLSNVSALPHRFDAIADSLAAQISRPVRWSESVIRLLSVDAVQFVEVGPGKTLTALLRRIRAQTCSPHLELFTRGS